MGPEYVFLQRPCADILMISGGTHTHGSTVFRIQGNPPYGAGAHQFIGPVHSGWTIASYFQYDPSLYSTLLCGMTWRYVGGMGGKCRLPWNTWDRWWVGPLCLLLLQRHSVPLFPVAVFPQAKSAYLHTCLCVRAAFIAKLICTVIEEWLRVIRNQAPAR